MGPGNTGFSAECDNIIDVSLNGVRKCLWSDAAMTFTGVSRAPVIQYNVAPSATIPGFSFLGLQTTGIGAASATELSLIADGVEGMRLSEASGSILQAPQADVGLTADVGSAQGNGVILSSYNVYSTVANAGDAATLPAVFIVDTVIYIRCNGYSRALQSQPSIAI